MIAVHWAADMDRQVFEGVKFGHAQKIADAFAGGLVEDDAHGASTVVVVNENHRVVEDTAAQGGIRQQQFCAESARDQ